MGINQVGSIIVTHINDWSVNAGGRKLKNGSAVRTRDGLYSVNGGDITINRLGPPVTMKYCSTATCDINFWEQDGLLLAKDPSIAVTPDTPPISIEFANPVAAVGAYVSVVGPAVLPDMQVQAVMWVKTVGDPTWHPVSAVGKVGLCLPKTAGATAPFVGASDDSGQHSIEQVRFDASLAVNFETLALSKLYWG